MLRRTPGSPVKNSFETVPFQPGESGNPRGRPKGARNKASVRIRDWATGIVEDPKVQGRLLTDARAGKLHPSVMTVLLAYAYGKSREASSPEPVISMSEIEEARRSLEVKLQRMTDSLGSRSGEHVVHRASESHHLAEFDLLGTTDAAPCALDGHARCAPRAAALLLQLRSPAWSAEVRTRDADARDAGGTCHAAADPAGHLRVPAVRCHVAERRAGVR